MSNRFDRSTLSSVFFQMESAEIPKIKQGGASSSNILNRYFAALAQDMALVFSRTSVIAARADRIELGAAAQAASTLGILQSLSSRVDAVTGATVLADMHSAFYLDTGSTTATVNNVFGQATLPIRSTENLLVSHDVYGRPFVSPEVEVSYTYTNLTATTPDSSLEFQVDPEAIYMIRGEQNWLKDTEGSARTWVRLRAPLQFRGLLPNVLEIWPFPAGAGTLYSIAYRETGDGATWTVLDLSYLSNYNVTTGVVDYFGPVRVHLPNEPIIEIAISMSFGGSATWGLHALSVWNYQYDATATLVVKDPYTRDVIEPVILRGKDPGDLSLLDVVLASNTASVTLSSTDTSFTPVITGVLFQV